MSNDNHAASLFNMFQAPATIDRAEAILLDFETVLIQLEARDRVSLLTELERLVVIAGALHPEQVAAEWGRNTGDNRSSDAIDRIEAIERDLEPHEIAA